jgi:hypothetical protein
MPDQSDDPVLYPPDAHSPDELAFLQEIRKAYDNWEIYGTDQAQVYKLRVWTYLLPGNPTMIRAELDGDILREILIKVVFKALADNPNLSEVLDKVGVMNLAEFRAKLEAEMDVPQFRDAQWKFFLRYFPPFLVGTYDIVVLCAFLATMLSTVRAAPDKDLDRIETLAREVLEAQVKELERGVKALVKTRSSGRPKVIEEAFPPIVGRVINIGRAIMGDATGEDAVPGLKQIAMAIDPDLTEDALGKRLKRVGYSWTNIKSHLAHPELRSDENHE